MVSGLESVNNFEKQGIYYGWIVVIAAFLIMAIVCGVFYSYGVFFIPIMTDFGWTRALTSGVALFSGLIYTITVPLTGFLADKYGFKLLIIICAGIMGLGLTLAPHIQTTWQLYLLLGLLPGLGASTAVVLPTAAVTQWFVRRRGMALGIAQSGIGVGAALVPLLATHLISGHGWRITYVILGLLIWLICIPVALLGIRNPEPGYLQAHEGRETTEIDPYNPGEKNHEYTLVEAASTSTFWFLFVLYGLCIFGLGLAMTHVVPYAQDMGLSAMTAAGLLTTIGVCSIIGRVSSGMISDKVGAWPVLLLCLILQTILMACLIKADAPWMFFIFAAFFGISYGGYIILIPKLTSQFFGLKSMGAVYGGLSVGDGIGFATGPIFAGYLFDRMGSYDIPFLSVAAGMFVAVILAFILREKGGRPSPFIQS
jgi:MFS family permease